MKNGRVFFYKWRVSKNAMEMVVACFKLLCRHLPF